LSRPGSVEQPGCDSSRVDVSLTVAIVVVVCRLQTVRSLS